MTSPQKTLSRALAWCVILGLAFAASGCAPKGKAQLEAADRSFATGDYDRAEIEYKNALQAAKNPDARAVIQLGKIYFAQGRIRPAYSYLQKALELQPDNLEVRAMLGRIFVTARRNKDAR